MNLRHKTLLLTTVPLLGFLVLVYASLSVILQRSYSRLEQQDAQRNVQRVEEAVISDLNHLHSLTEDWAAWDDTYQFIRDGNAAYVESNFQKYAFESLRMNVLVLVNTEGEVIYSNAYDLEKGEFAPVPPGVLAQLEADSPLLRFPHVAYHHQGLMRVEDLLILAVVEPILRSDATGPPRGAMLMGRYLNSAMVEDLSRRTQVSLTVHPDVDNLENREGQGANPPDLQGLLDPMMAEINNRRAANRVQTPTLGRVPSPTRLQAQDRNLLKGYALWPDIYGHPQALVDVTLPRDIHRQGQLSQRSLGLALLGACLISTAAILLLLDRVILRRVVKLSQEVQQIGRSNDLTQRVVVQGHDELSQLSQRVNDMLGELQVSAERLQEEQQRAEDLLLNILPEPIADELMQTQASVPQHFDEVSILFADIVGFTSLSSRLSPIQLVNLLNQIFSSFDALAEQFGLEKIKTIGDAYMVAAGLPTPRPDHAEAMAEMALAMQQVTATFEAEVGVPLQIRIGINTGVVVAGVIGTKKFIYDLWGDAVNIASRMESLGEPGLIQVTASTYERLKDSYQLEPRGSIHVKGRGEMETFWLRGRQPNSQDPHAQHPQITPAPGISVNS
ncbi:MAG: adenylate/guanylate cyclase domain-containing protein [Spirulina sp.]